MIGPTGLFHKMWRGHNREPIFSDPCDKDAYLSHLRETYSDDVRSEVKWFSFCLMGNHTHETGGLVPTADGGIRPSQVVFSDWMRSAHSRFGAEFNRRHDRQGKVAYDRPKTKGIDDDEAVLTVMFYGDANPVAAGLVAHPSHYREYSSYRYYAFGERSANTEALTQPPAYLALGKTAKERQRRYRKMCDEYLRNKGLLDDRPSDPRMNAEGEGASGCSGSTPISDDNSTALVDDVNARGAPTVT